MIAAVLAQKAPEQATLVEPDGVSVPLPEQLNRVLRVAAEALAEGHAVTMAPLHTLLSTQEAAELLNISRPTLLRLLESGEIPCEKPGRHRLIRLTDLLAYRDRLHRQRREDLARLTREAAEDDLYTTTARPVRTR
ncbi:MAG TPA: helix-turn-helix domain-containing protein [Pseudonocardiaceae bacterium]